MMLISFPFQHNHWVKFARTLASIRTVLLNTSRILLSPPSFRLSLRTNLNNQSKISRKIYQKVWSVIVFLSVLERCMNLFSVGCRVSQWGSLLFHVIALLWYPQQCTECSETGDAVLSFSASHVLSPVWNIMILNFPAFSHVLN